MNTEEELRRSLATCVCECSILKQQRDELLAALELVASTSDLQWATGSNGVHDAVRNAIAKVKEQS